MKLKLNADGSAVVQDGKPVYIHDDGKEVPFDAPTAVSTISRLNGEAKTHREEKEALSAKVKLFEGIEDVEAAKKALETIKALDDKKLVDAGKVEEVKRAAVQAAEEKAMAAAKAHATELKTITDKYEALNSQYNSEKIGGMFKGSTFVKDKVKVPVDMVEAKFGRNFKVEDGKIVGYDNAGNKIYSRLKPGELAEPDEALEQLVDAYPAKTEILKGANHTGSGSQESDGDKGTGSGQGSNVKLGGTREERTKALAERFPELAKA
jgi:hypothetical protein